MKEVLEAIVTYFKTIPSDTLIRFAVLIFIAIAILFFIVHIFAKPGTPVLFGLYVKDDRSGSVALRASTSAKSTIESPSDGDVVPQVINVEGTHAHVPSDRELWLYRQDVHSGLCYADPIVRHNNGRWQTGSITIGASDSKGVVYSMAVVLVDQQVGNKLRRDRDNIRDCASYPSLDSITVTRQ